MARLSLARELVLFLKEEKEWWLLPLLLVLLLLGAALSFASSSVWAPFLYPLF